MRTRRAIALALPLALAGCGDGSQPEEQAKDGLVIGGQEAPVAELYQMPTPNELFGLVRQLAGDGQRRMLSATSTADRFMSQRARALNFGIYATDLVYASSFKLNVEVARYYLASKRLAESLGLTNAFTDADFVRLESNLTKGDSLEVISNGAYQRAYDRMQEEQMGPVLAMVLAGGWMESMHLVIKQVEAFGKNEGLIARVAEQKVTLEHLLELMEEHKANADVAAVRAQLLGLREQYDQLGMKRMPHAGASASGRMVLGDDVSIELTDAKFADLAAAVEALRSDWTRPEDAIQQ
jgi:hypothetical protein